MLTHGHIRIKQEVHLKRKKHIVIGAVILAALLLVAAIICGILISDKSEANEVVQPSASSTSTPTALPEISSSAKTDSPVPTPSSTEPPKASQAPASTATKKPSPSLFCTLTILGSKIEVYDSVDEVSLKKRPGWLSSSALPGEDGMCVIYGHRNRRHFRVLENISIGDEIMLTMTDGTIYTYTVKDTTIYESTDELRLPALDGTSLVLVTCYPFHYSGNAPGKFVCLGSK